MSFQTYLPLTNLLIPNPPSMSYRSCLSQAVRSPQKALSALTLANRQLSF